MIGRLASDTELLDAWRGGDATAGRELFERHADAVSCFFRNKVGDEREDLIQRTFLACVEARDRIREGRSFRAYLLRIARHELYDHFAARARRDSDPLSTSVRQYDVTPSGVVATQQRDQLLLIALQHLPLELQACLELHYWEELTMAELAEVFDVAPGTAKSRLFRARELLREALVGLLERDPDAPRIDLRPPGDLDAQLEGWAKQLRAQMRGRVVP
jgi:RNA polymerase sigma-70 factor (ECF subfamily)